MKIERTQVYGFDAALRGMRNPMNSWNRSDSLFCLDPADVVDVDLDDVAEKWTEKICSKIGDSQYQEIFDAYWMWLSANGTIRKDTWDDVVELALIGPNDMDLARRLIAGGPVHAKFMRQIGVSVDITAPLYWWKEFDTYKVGTVANSTSTMHKLATTPITIDCFEIDDYNPDLALSEKISLEDEKPLMVATTMKQCANSIIAICEELRLQYLKTKDIRYWKELVRWLPSGWRQTRTVTMNYENLRNIYKWRKNHKLTEWHKFCDWILTLPYAHELIAYKNEAKT